MRAKLQQFGPREPHQRFYLFWRSREVVNGKRIDCDRWYTELETDFKCLSLAPNLALQYPLPAPATLRAKCEAGQEMD